MSARHAAVVLAAGASHRLGQPKQLLGFGAATLLHHAVRCARATAPARLLVVVGARADAVFCAIEDEGAERVDCVDWHEGMSASLRAGIARLLAGRMDGALLLACDQPALTAAHLQALLARWQAAPGCAVASAYAGTLGVPALLPRAWFPDIMALRGDRGARDLLRDASREVAGLPMPGLSFDLDTPADLAKMARQGTIFGAQSSG